MYLDSLPTSVESTVKNSKALQLRYVFLVCLLLAATLTAAGVYNYTHKTISLSSSAMDQRTIEEQYPEMKEYNGMVGVAGSSSRDSTDTSFAVVSEVVQAPRIGTLGSCNLGELFIIGEVETSAQNNPVDELSWVGALDIVPDYKNPFVVGASGTSTFPWRTDERQTDTLETTLVFDYAGNTAQSELVMGWSPGKNGEKQKEVILDNDSIGKTRMHTGFFDESSWEYMPRVIDTVPMLLTTGKHTITIKHLSKGSGESVWDYIKMNVTECK